jgi:N-acetylglucosaminyldiphosphoundecaprenol N-acetyl-beta-D-mannosaminyltransferase
MKEHMDDELLMGYRVVSGGPEACCDAIAEWIDTGTGCRWLACLNPHSYVVARDRPEFATALQQADWLVPDGVGIMLAAWLLRCRLAGRVTGADVFDGVNRRLDAVGGSVFFLGATEDTLDLIKARFSRDYPMVRIAGWLAPPFRDAFSAEERDAMEAAVRGAVPDVLWVGLTSPKQDLWIFESRHRLGVKFAAGIGAVFDFYSGRVQRSPAAFQRMGLEWLPRLLREPMRLWRRMFISAPVFVAAVLREVMRSRSSRSVSR